IPSRRPAAFHKATAARAAVPLCPRDGDAGASLARRTQAVRSRRNDRATRADEHRAGSGAEGVGCNPSTRLRSTLSSVMAGLAPAIPLIHAPRVRQFYLYIL